MHFKDVVSIKHLRVPLQHHTLLCFVKEGNRDKFSQLNIYISTLCTLVQFI